MSGNFPLVPIYPDFSYPHVVFPKLISFLHQCQTFKYTPRGVESHQLLLTQAGQQIREKIKQKVGKNCHTSTRRKRKLETPLLFLKTTPSTTATAANHSWPLMGEGDGGGPLPSTPHPFSIFLRYFAIYCIPTQ